MSGKALAVIALSLLLLGCTQPASQPTTQPTAATPTATIQPTAIPTIYYSSPAPTPTPDATVSSPSPRAQVQEKCSGFRVFECLSFNSTSTEAVIVIRNPFGETYDVEGIVLRNSDNQEIYYYDPLNPPVRLSKDTTLTVDKIKAPPANSDGEFEMLIGIRYKVVGSENNPLLEDTGTVSGRIR